MVQRGKAKARRNEDEIIHMDEHIIPLSELYSRLGSNPERGLTTKKACEVFARDGPNVLTSPRKTPEWIKLCKNFFGGFALHQWILAIFCFIFYSLKESISVEASDDNLYIGVLLCVGAIVTGVFSYYQEAKSSKIMESLENMVPQYATVIRDGKKLTMPAEKIVVGDVIEVKSGDLIPADMRIISSNEMKVDNSSLTGEFEPQTRTPEDRNPNPVETRNLAFFSTNCVQGTARGIVFYTGDRTVMGHIANFAFGLDAGDTPIIREINHFTYLNIRRAYFLSFIFCNIVTFIIGYNWLDTVNFLICIIVSNASKILLATATMYSMIKHRLAGKLCLELGVCVILLNSNLGKTISLF